MAVQKNKFRQGSTRRDAVRALAKAAVIAAFHTGTRSWLTANEVSQDSATSGLPTSDGRLVTDNSSLTAASDDFAHIVHRRPIAVLQPGSVNDVVTMVQYARQHQIHVAARGQGHSTHGQDQADAGIVIDMSFLHRIRSIDAVSTWVDGGVKWIDLLRESLPLAHANRQLFDRCVAIGGKRYPVDSVPLDKGDWQKHYGPLWGLVVSYKERFDPDHILTPGQGIFA